jgi:hypothetical protein
MKMMIESGADLTIKNKNCESVREYVERYSYDLTDEYLALENKVLVNALIGQ